MTKINNLVICYAKIVSFQFTLKDTDMVATAHVFM